MREAEDTSSSISRVMIDIMMCNCSTNALQQGTIQLQYMYDIVQVIVWADNIGVRCICPAPKPICYGKVASNGQALVSDKFRQVFLDRWL